MANVIKKCNKCLTEKEHTERGRHCIDCKKNYDKNRVSLYREELKLKGKEYRSKYKNKEAKRLYDIQYRENYRDQKIANCIKRTITGKSYIDTRKSVLKKKYNMSIEEYKAIVNKQNNLCAICLNEQKVTKTNKLYIDHDHKTGKVRQLLCSTCNSGLGHFKDSPELLLKAAEYLKLHQNTMKLPDTLILA